MKKEEACRRIDNLDFYLRHYTSPDYSERDHEAMMMAKKALEQESKIVPIAVIKFEYDEDKLKELADKAVLTVRQSDVTEVLDKIRAEIKVLSPEPTAYDVVDGNPVKDAIWETLIEVDKIIDKYKAESEDT